MKNLFLLFFIGMLWMTSCSKTKKATDASEEQRVYQIDSVDRNTGVQRMKSWQADLEITAGGKRYRLFIRRAPADSLPAVESEMGTFTDNRIAVSITRADRSQLFGKTFTKKDFAAFLPDAYLSRSILEGVVLDNENTANGKGDIVLAASVSFPMTDLYVPFTITIAPSGKVAIEKEEDTVDVTLWEAVADSTDV